MSKTMYIEKKTAFELAVKSIGDACLDDKTCFEIFQALPLEDARIFAKNGFSVKVINDGKSTLTKIEWSEREGKLTYTTETGSIEETYDMFGFRVSRKVFDTEGVRVWQKDSHIGYAYSRKSTFDDEGVRVACVAG